MAFVCVALRHRLPRAEIDPVGYARRAVLPEHSAHHRIIDQLRNRARVQEWHLRCFPLTANFEPALYAPLPIPAGGRTREGKPDLCAGGSRQHQRIGLTAGWSGLGGTFSRSTAARERCEDQ